MTINHARVERVAAELRALPADPAMRLRHLVSAWPEATGAEIEAVAARARLPAQRVFAGKRRRVLWQRPDRGLYVGLSR